MLKNGGYVIRNVVDWENTGIFLATIRALLAFLAEEPCLLRKVGFADAVKTDIFIKQRHFLSYCSVVDFKKVQSGFAKPYSARRRLTLGKFFRGVLEVDGVTQYAVRS
jgi:hypothetical protein